VWSVVGKHCCCYVTAVATARRLLTAAAGGCAADSVLGLNACGHVLLLFSDVLPFQGNLMLLLLLLSGAVITCCCCSSCCWRKGSQGCFFRDVSSGKDVSGGRSQPGRPACVVRYTLVKVQATVHCQYHLHKGCQFHKQPQLATVRASVCSALLAGVDR
jgi:hypothetical protein